MKIEWRKDDKALYLPPRKPVTIDVPELKYVAISGKGSPGTDAFQACISVLYTMGFGVKMLPKQGITPEGYAEYTLYPLEGIWNLTEPWDYSHPLNKSDLTYDLMMRMPDFVTDELFDFVRERAAKKKEVPARLGDARFITLTEGLCVQTMHIGSYDDEPATFTLMDVYATENQLARLGDQHREIYLSDPRKAKPEALKTVLRYQVQKTNT